MPVKLGGKMECLHKEFFVLGFFIAFILFYYISIIYEMLKIDKIK